MKKGETPISGHFRRALGDCSSPRRGGEGQRGVSEARRAPRMRAGGGSCPSPAVLGAPVSPELCAKAHHTRIPHPAAHSPRPTSLPASRILPRIHVPHPASRIPFCLLPCTPPCILPLIPHPALHPAPHIAPHPASRPSAGPRDSSRLPWLRPRRRRCVFSPCPIKAPSVIEIRGRFLRGGGGDGRADRAPAAPKKCPFVRPGGAGAAPPGALGSPQPPRGVGSPRPAPGVPQHGASAGPPRYPGDGDPAPAVSAHP